LAKERTLKKLNRCPFGQVMALVILFYKIRMLDLGFGTWRRARIPESDFG